MHWVTARRLARNPIQSLAFLLEGGVDLKTKADPSDGLLTEGCAVFAPGVNPPQASFDHCEREDLDLWVGYNPDQFGCPGGRPHPPYRGPDASFGVFGEVRDEGDTYRVQFEHTPLEFERDETGLESFLYKRVFSYQWDFGDGSTCVWTQEDGSGCAGSNPGFPVHNYEKPRASAEVSLTVVDIDGRSDSTQQTIMLEEATSLSVNLRFSDNRTEGGVDLGEEFEITVDIQADDGPGGVSGISLDTAFTNADNLSVLDAPSGTTGFSLAPGGSRSFSWRLRADRGGRWRISSTVRGTNALGTPLEEDDVLDGSVEGTISAVEIVFPDDGVNLPKSEDEVGLEETEFPVTIKVTVADDGQAPDAQPDKVTQLVLGVAGDPDPLKISQVRFVEETGSWVPMPSPSPFPIRIVSGPEPISFAKVAEGTSVEFRYVLAASATGTFDFAATVEGLTDGPSGPKTVRRASPDDSRLTVRGEALLGIRLEVSGATQIDEGEAVEVIGTVANLTDDKWLQLAPVRIISEGQGIVRGPVEFDSGVLPERGELGFFEPYLPPEPEATDALPSVAQFRVRIETDRIPGMDWNLARFPVLVTAAIGGDVIDEDGNRRALTPADFSVSFGAGKFENSRGTYLRVPVEPRPIPPRVLEPNDYFLELYGRGLENLARGGKNGVISLLQMMQSLDETGIALATLAASELDRDRKAVKQGFRLMWAWMDWQTEIYLDLQNTEELERTYLEIAADLDEYYSSNEIRADAIRQAVRGSVDQFFVNILDWGDRAWTSANAFGTNQELAGILAEPLTPVGQVAGEEIAATGFLMFLNRISRSLRVSEIVSEGRSARLEQQSEAIEAATQSQRASWVERAGNDPRLNPAPRSMRDLPARTPVTSLQALRGWAIDRVSDRNLREITRELGIIVAVRSRADETIQWLEATATRAGKTIKGIVLKPFNVKAKTADFYDVNYLGYRDGVGYRNASGAGGGDKGSVVLAEPLSLNEVTANLDLRQADEFTRQQVLKRHSQRWKEWYGVECCEVPSGPGAPLSEVDRLRQLAPDFNPETRTYSGKIEVPDRGVTPIPEDNLDTRGSFTRTRQLRFELRQVPDPNAASAANAFDREYLEVWMEDIDNPGVMKRMGGDTDIVSVNKKDGGMLDAATEETQNIARQLRDRVDAQHPWTTTLDNPEVRRNLLDAHRWSPDPAQRGEPLLLYVNGEAKVGWYDPSRDIDMGNPLDSMLWLDGSHADIEDVVNFNRDLRQSLPDPLDSRIRPYTATSTSLRTALDLSETASEISIAACSIRTTRVAGAVYRVGARLDQVEKFTPQGEWVETAPESECTDGVITIVPETILTEAASAGSRVLQILEDALDFDFDDFFLIGDKITIGAEGPTPETGTYASKGSIVLDEPLRYDHLEGTRVYMTQARSGEDRDGDGIADENDAFPNDPDEFADFDGDGIGNDSDTFPNARTTLVASTSTSQQVRVSVTPEDALSACQLEDVALSPFVAPSGRRALPFQIAFTLSNCQTGERVDVEIDVGQVIATGSQIYKVVGGELGQLIATMGRGDGVLRYSLADGGPLDEDTRDGSIADPVTVVLSGATAIPALPPIHIGLLSICLLGLAAIFTRQLAGREYS
ncbi:MAG: hypothetical protein Cons2KO_30030 [Congregibacter sp.]